MAGMSLLLLIPLNQTGPDGGVLVFSAPGYRPLSMRIEQKELPGGVSRRHCPEEKGCYEIEAVLEAEAPLRK